jgi:ribosomal protein S18 acetylase RimI-like enzyme
MIIRQLSSQDLDFAAGLTEREGWDSSTKQQLSMLLEFDPPGCLIAEQNGERLGMCFGTAYHEFGFIGEFIVMENIRGKGIGTQLIKAAIENLQSRGIHNIYLDGVPNALSLYERLGFRKICGSLRMSGILDGKAHSDIRKIQKDDLDSIFSLDREVFGDDRSFFLRERLKNSPNFCLVQEQDAAITGFILAHAGREDISVGPWIVTSNNNSPQNLLEGFALLIGKRKLQLGILELNQNAISIVESLGLCVNPEHPVRMFCCSYGDIAFPGKVHQAYAIGSPSKG